MHADYILFTVQGTRFLEVIELKNDIAKDDIF
jgi:hypothetical protein